MPSIPLPLLLVTLASVNTPRTAEPAEAIVPPTILTAVQQEVDSALRDINRAAEASARAVELATGGEGEIRQILALVASHDPSIIDCAWIDAKGSVRWAEAAHDRAGSRAGSIPRAGFAQVRATREPSLAACVGPTVESPAVDLEYPAFASDDHLIGAVSILFEPRALLDRIVQAHSKESDWEIWILDASDRLIYSPSPVFDMSELLKSIGAAPRGRGMFECSVSGDAETVTREACWATVTMHDSPWRVIASRPTVKD